MFVYTITDIIGLIIVSIIVTPFLLLGLFIGFLYFTEFVGKILLKIKNMVKR